MLLLHWSLLSLNVSSVQSCHSFVTLKSCSSKKSFLLIGIQYPSFNFILWEAIKKVHVLTQFCSVFQLTFHFRHNIGYGMSY